MTGSEETVVAPNGADLRRIADLYGTGSQKLADYANRLQLAKVSPGWVQQWGDLLKTQWGQRKGDLVTAIRSLQDAFDTLGRQLVRIAASYADTEALNQDDAARVGELVADLSAKFPDLPRALNPSSGNIPNLPGG